jgi:CRISPR-associated protein Cas5t
VLAIQLEVPIACWRKGYARELLETEAIPPPATCYGSLLAFIGEIDRERHKLARVTSGVVGKLEKSTVVRTTWRVKSAHSLPGNGENAKPDFQQLLTGASVVIWLDSSDEEHLPSLEERVAAAFKDPASVSRFGGWSLGESTHLINDAYLLPSCAPPSDCHAFIVETDGTTTLPVWVDHVGTSGTKYAVGTIRSIIEVPRKEQLAQIA